MVWREVGGVTLTNVELKKWISDIVIDEDELNNIIVLEGDEFADAVVGITVNNELVYSYELIVKSLVEKCNISEDEAIEFIEYNTIRSIPYMSGYGNAPIILRYARGDV